MTRKFFVIKNMSCSSSPATTPPSSPREYSHEHEDIINKFLSNLLLTDNDKKDIIEESAKEMIEVAIEKEKEKERQKRNEYMRNYRLKNKDKIKAQQKEYRKRQKAKKCEC